jgi:hypothetical protein
VNWIVFVIGVVLSVVAASVDAASPSPVAQPVIQQRVAPLATAAPSPLSCYQRWQWVPGDGPAPACYYEVASSARVSR